MVEIPFVGWNETGDEASFNDQPSAEAFADRFGGEVERVGVAFRVTGSKGREQVNAAFASKGAKDVTPKDDK